MRRNDWRIFVFNYKKLKQVRVIIVIKFCSFYSPVLFVVGEPVPASVAKAVSTATKEPTAAKKLAKLKEAEALPPGRAVVNIVAEGWYPELCK